MPQLSHIFPILILEKEVSFRSFFIESAKAVFVILESGNSIHLPFQLYESSNLLWEYCTILMEIKEKNIGLCFGASSPLAPFIERRKGEWVDIIKHIIACYDLAVLWNFIPYTHAAHFNIIRKKLDLL